MLAARDLLARVPLNWRGLSTIWVVDPATASNSCRALPRRKHYGLDTSEAMLDHARTHAPRARFVKQNIVDWAPTARWTSSPITTCSSPASLRRSLLGGSDEYV